MASDQKKGYTFFQSQKHKLFISAKLPCVMYLLPLFSSFQLTKQNDECQKLHEEKGRGRNEIIMIEHDIYVLNVHGKFLAPCAVSIKHRAQK